ncbi:hypothetical protein ACHHRT_12725 [Desulfurivibrio sp. D14AmB]|uniref:hypothetical protein n=1 Tax=Desulfurivibrio sp. D14AmB TaxID=3374370 RepID=UPI00376EB9D8
MELADRRAIAGQVNLVIGPIEGAVDDFMDIVAEINTRPGDTSHVPCVHIGQGYEMICSVFSDAGDLLLRLDGSSLECCGEGVFRIRREQP